MSEPRSPEVLLKENTVLHERLKELELAESKAKRTQTKLKNSYHLIRNILDNITDGFWAVDHRWRITFLNKVALRGIQKFHITRNPEELIGKIFWDIFPDGVGSVFFKQYNRAMQSQTTVVFEAFYPPLNAWFESRAYPNAGGLSLYFREITAKKKIAEELLDSELRYRTLAESLRDVIITMDQDGIIRYANAAAEIIFGHSNSELLDKPFTHLLPESLRETHIRTLSDYLQTGIRPLDWDGSGLPGLHKNGNLIPLEITFLELVEHGKIIFIGILRDLSERKESPNPVKVLVNLH